MEHILARAKKVAEEAEVFQITSEETQIHFEANRLKQLQSKQQTSVALRLVKGGRTGYATTTDPGDGQELVKNALETATFGTEAKFKLPGLAKYPPVEVFDAAVASVVTPDMIKLGEAMIEAVTRHTPGILCEAGVSQGTISVSLINSRGGKSEYRKSFFDLGIEGTLIEGTDMLFVGESESSCHPISETGTVIKLVLEQLELAKNRAQAPAKEMPVIFTPNGVAGTFMPSLMAAFNGKTVFEGASPIGDKVGQKAFDEKLSLADDPMLAYRPASRPADDEGVPSQRTSLVEKGTVMGFLYDLQTAALAGKKSTGSGSRGRGLPSPSPSAFIIAPGSTAFEEMIQDMKEGLIVEQLMGAEQGNVLGGDFSGNVLLGYKVESGKIVGRVKNTMVSGNVYQALKDIAAVGSQTRWVGGFLHTPHIYIPKLSVASKG
jgi:PmbA protein